MAKTKKRGRRVKTADIHATEALFTGPEPDWTNWESWHVEKFFAEHARAFRFYTYYSKMGEIKKDVINWMKERNFSKDDIKAVRNAPDNMPGMATSILCRCSNRGMPLTHPEGQKYIDSMGGRSGKYESDEPFIREHIAKAIIAGQSVVEIKEEQKDNPQAPKKISPRERLRQVLSKTVLADLEGLLDDLILNKKVTEKFDLFAILNKQKVPGMGLSFVHAWIDEQLAEVQAAYDETDPDLVEGYSYLTKTQLADWIKVYEGLRSDVIRYKKSITAHRVKRKQRIPKVKNQVENLQYASGNDELKLTSINPLQIVGAYRLLVYNVANRNFYDYVAEGPSGLSVRGSKLVGYSEKKTRGRKLRKPDEVLSDFLTKTPRQIEKVWDSLTTKVWLPNGRINKDMVLLRVLNK